MKFSSVWKQSVGGIAGAENIAFEEGPQAGGRMIRQPQRFPCAHEEMTREGVTNPCEVSGVPHETRVIQDLILIKGEFELV
jgi:hypothetical protein